MTLMSENNLLTSALAHACDVKPKTLRNWIDRNCLAFTNVMADQRPGWKKYSLYGVAALALTKHFAKFGLSVEDASVFANLLIRANGADIDEVRTITVSEFLSGFKDKLIVLDKDEIREDWTIKQINVEEIDLRWLPASFGVLDLSRILFVAFSKAVPDFEYENYGERYIDELMEYSTTGWITKLDGEVIQR